MKTEKIIILIFWLVASGLWSMSIWGGWAEKVYEKKKGDYWIWYWLRIFHIELTKRSCIAFIKGISMMGIIIITLGTLVVLLRNL